ncbi:MAG: hypothetical protein KatS3mg078_0651 [Deltaproteobacteria bacterium]|nr:MAG: hypothetical protein KatS3mg078_0651 [Deltaproteobacteria bacterium]
MAKPKEIVGKRNAKVGYGSKRANRRKEIIRVASKLFSEKSYHDVTMEEIAEKVGCCKGYNLPLL